MVLQQRAHVVQAQVGLVEKRHLVDDLGDGAFQLTDIGAGAFRDVHLDVFRNGEISFAFVLLVFLDEALDDAELRLYFRRLDVEGAAGVEAALVALVDVDVLGRAVG